MLSDIFELRADWGLRRESVEECAARLARMLDRLSDLHPGFRHLIVEPNWNAARPSGLLIPPDIRDLNHLVSSLQVAGALPPDFDLIDPAMSIPGFAELLRALGVVSAEFTPSFEEEFEPGPSFDEFCDLPFDYSNITITYEDQGDGMGIYCGIDLLNPPVIPGTDRVAADAFDFIDRWDENPLERWIDPDTGRGYGLLDLDWENTLGAGRCCFQVRCPQQVSPLKTRRCSKTSAAGPSDFRSAAFEQSMSVSPEHRDLASLRSDELLARWVEAVQAQAAARHIGRRNRLLTTCDRILDMLKSRTDGTARVLQPLLAHPDPEVRLSAAMKYREVDRDAFLAVATELAKRRDKVGEGARGSLRWDERIKDKPDAPPKCVVPHESWFRWTRQAVPTGLSVHALTRRLREAFPTSELAERLLGLARPSIGIWPQRLGADAAPTASRLGGLPSVPASWSWPPCALSFFETLDLPHPLSDAVWALALSDGEARRYDVTYHNLSAQAHGVREDRYQMDITKMFGWPDLIQGDLENIERNRHRDGQLLFQLGNYDNGIEVHGWGPGGVLNFVIDKTDPAAARFDRVDSDMQCT